MTDVFYAPHDWSTEVKILVDLADHPDQVAVDTGNGMRLRLPDWLWDRYQRYLSLDSEPAEATSTSVPAKRGRKPKSTEESRDG